MNSIMTALLAPWRAGQRWMRWFSAIVVVLCALGALGIGIFEADPGWSLHSAVSLSFGLAYLWAFVMPNTLLLAMDARTLRIPAIERRVITSLVTYALLGVLPATLILGLFGGNMANIGAVLALGTVGGLAFAVLPRYIAMWFGFFPAILIGLQHAIHVPGPASPLFTHWAVPVVVVLLVVDIVRWWQLLRHPGKPSPKGMRAPMVLMHRHCGVWGVFGSTSFDTSSQRIRNSATWMQTGVDLRKTGPHRLVPTLRVALGGWYVPRTLRGHLPRLAPIAFSLLLFPLVMLLISWGDGPIVSPWRTIGMGVLSWVGIFGAAMLAAVGIYTLRRRWVQVNSELPLLALLPRLGLAGQTKHSVLSTSLGLPLIGIAVLLALMLAVAWGLGLHGPDLLLVALSQFGCGVLLVALALNTLGGRPLRNWVASAFVIVVFTLLGLSTFIPIASLGKHVFSGQPLIVHGLIAAWLVVDMLLGWVGQRGWRALVHRPHVFLANPR